MLRRWSRRIAIAFVGLLALGALGFGAVLLFRPEALVFHPIPGGSAKPSDWGLRYEDVWLKTPDGERLHAWFIRGQGASAVRPTVLYCHGNTGNLSRLRLAIEGLSKTGADFLIFDYRGYGRSTGRISEAGTLTDARAAWDHLVEAQGISPDRIVIWGRSLGGAVAIGLAHQVQSAGLILESTFTSVDALAVEIYSAVPSSWVRRVNRVHYPSAARISSIRTPLLIAHSPEDQLVGVHHGRKLFAAAKSAQKRFVSMHGSHREGHLTSPRYRQELLRFLAALEID